MEQDKALLYDASKRSIAATYALWFFFGWLGAHRFYAGYKLSGFLMLALAALAWYRVIAVEEAVFLAFTRGAAPPPWWQLRPAPDPQARRSEERRGGKECGGTCRSRW